MDDASVQFEKPKSLAKYLPVIISALLIAAIIGGAAWFYLAEKKSHTATPVVIPTTDTTTSTEQTDTPANQATSVKTHLNSTIQQLNSELSAMAADGSSTEDATPTL